MTRKRILLLSSAALCIYLFLKMKQSKAKNKRTLWSRNWLRRRENGKGLLNMLNMELAVEDPSSYQNFLRLDNQQFQKLLHLIQNDITKTDTFMRDSVSASNRLEVTLRFLASGDTYRSLMYATRIHESTISRFVPEVCNAIYKRLKNEYLTTPTTCEEWEKIAETFFKMWNFPLCLGALDGRHIKFRPPISAGSYYFNYKGDHSIVLLAMCDAMYKFTYVNVGVNGRVSDGGVFRESNLKEALETNLLHFPTARALPGRNTNKIPYVIVADEAFPLSPRLMKPYSKRDLNYESRIFNYRLSRARRVIENAFGILANRFRVLLNPINLSPEKAEIITLACVTLHNFLATENWNAYTDCDEITENLKALGVQGANRSNTTAQFIRDEFKKYFNSPQGSVDWQDEAVANNNM